jgi:hypothetical protein
MATDAELLAEAKKIDAANKRKRPNPSQKKGKGKGKRIANKSKASVAKCAPRKNEHKNVTIVLPHGAHLAMVGSTFEVRGGKRTAPAKRKTKPARKKTTPKRRKRKAKSDE